LQQPPQRERAALIAASFIQADGQGRHGLARTLGGPALTIGAGIAAAFAARGLVFPILKANLTDAPETVRSAALALTARGMFACALVGLFLGVRYLHGRPIRSLISTAARSRFGHLLLGLIVSGGLIGVVGYVMHPSAMKPLTDLPLAAVACSYLAMLIGFSIQATTEEVLFRGYIMQVAWRGFRSIWAAAGLSAVHFSLAHLGYNLGYRADHHRPATRRVGVHHRSPHWKQVDRRFSVPGPFPSQ
jgi:membrane protease YdiL (CAAX protease family)